MISDLWTDQHNVRLYTVKQNVENGWRYDILISVYSNKISPTMILMIVNVIWPTRMYCELVYISLTIIFFYNIKMICTIITLYIGLCIKTLLYTTFNQIKNLFEYLLWGKAKKKICVFTVTQPTLIFASDPMHFYTEFG